MPGSDLYQPIVGPQVAPYEISIKSIWSLLFLCSVCIYTDYTHIRTHTQTCSYLRWVSGGPQGSSGVSGLNRGQSQAGRQVPFPSIGSQPCAHSFTALWSCEKVFLPVLSELQISLTSL